jgi:hypothetical protein
MRFENNAREHLLVDPGNFDEFARRGHSADYADGGPGRFAQRGQKTNDLLVRPPINRRRGDIQFPGIAQTAGKARLLCAGPDLKLEARFQ